MFYFQVWSIQAQFHSLPRCQSIKTLLPLLPFKISVSILQYYMYSALHGGLVVRWVVQNSILLVASGPPCWNKSLICSMWQQIRVSRPVGSMSQWSGLLLKCPWTGVFRWLLNHEYPLLNSWLWAFICRLSSSPTTVMKYAVSIDLTNFFQLAFADCIWTLFVGSPPSWKTKRLREKVCLSVRMTYSNRPSLSVTDATAAASWKHNVSIAQYIAPRTASPDPHTSLSPITSSPNGWHLLWWAVPGCVIPHSTLLLLGVGTILVLITTPTSLKQHLFGVTHL